MQGFPAATGVDIFAENFLALIPWAPENKPALTDWLADPSELERLQS